MSNKLLSSSLSCSSCRVRLFLSSSITTFLFHIHTIDTLSPFFCSFVCFTWLCTRVKDDWSEWRSRHCVTLLTLVNIYLLVLLPHIVESLRDASAPINVASYAETDDQIVRTIADTVDIWTVSVQCAYDSGASVHLSERISMYNPPTCKCTASHL